MAAVMQRNPGGAQNPLGRLQAIAGGANIAEQVAELQAIVNAKVKLEQLWQAQQTDVDAKQNQALNNLGNTKTFSEFALQMDSVIQAEKDLATAETKKKAEAEWLQSHGIDLIKSNPKAAEALEDQLELSLKQQGQPDRSQLNLLKNWEKQIKPTYTKGKGKGKEQAKGEGKGKA